MAVRMPKRTQDEPKVSRHAAPDDMPIDEWQTQLRKQYGRKQNYRLQRLGDRPAFSDFLVTNPDSKRSYQVTVRGRGLRQNRCTCPDFATNDLGTCKHIEFVLARLETRRAARAELNAGYEPGHAEISLHYGMRRTVAIMLPRAAGKKFQALVNRYFHGGILRDDCVDRFDEFLAAASFHDPEMCVGEDVLAFVAESRDAAERRGRLKELFPRGVRSKTFGKLLRTELYDYQREGVLFAAAAGRCLIGDEMGLGKTVQALGTAEVLARIAGVERVLIICPTSLKHQWRREIERFTGRSVLVIEGSRLKRMAAYAVAGPFFKIVNYDTIHADLPDIQHWSPDLVVLDEAQRIKNWSTRAARSVKLIRSPHALVLTGTPLENRLEELISIVQFVDQHRLGPTYRLLHQHQTRDENGRVIGYRDLDHLGQSLAPILLRRRKDEVLEQLPERITSTLFVPTTPLQDQLHEENKEIVGKIVQKWKRMRFLSEADKQRLMIALQKMRMCADSSYLLDAATNHGPKPAEITTVLSELLERPGVKAVVFSQWLRMHELLMREAAARGWGNVLFHGGVPGTKRGGLIDRFRDDPECRVFFSTDAGGVGLNLQFASVVVNADLPWNPAVLEQRIGRVHRLGQRQPVRVLNFVSRGTIEEGMLEVLRFKKGLFAGVLDGGESAVALGGSRLSKFMDSVEATTRAIPESIAEETETAPPDGSAPSVPVEAVLQKAATVLNGVQEPAAAGAGPRVEIDPSTGESFVRMPAAAAAELANVLESLKKLLTALGR